MTWTDQALCAQVGGDAWYPEHGSSPDASRRVCQRCPVKVECLEWAIAPPLRHGAMFAGYGGLDMGIQSVIGGETTWLAEVAHAPSRILAHRFPGVPNLGDVTAVDWRNVEPVDVITGGSPCQDVSSAGKRAGMKPGTRSGLWASMCDAIDIIRPSLVVWENVRGALSAEANSAMEPCPGCVGDGHDGPALRALGRVLGDLADIGYDARWYGLRAADVGAPHGRFRIFVFASPAPDSDSGRHGKQQDARGVGRLDRPHEDGTREWQRARPIAECRGATAPAHAAHLGHEWIRASRDGRAGPADSRCNVADPTRDGRDEGWPESAGQLGRPHVAERGASASPDAVGGGRDGRARDEERGTIGRTAPAGRGSSSSNGTARWGPYADAIARWERVLGRPAPDPTEPGPRGGQRLSPRFTEWLMGLPDGWVTDVPGLSLAEQLTALGNGVVPAQAAAATNAWISSRGPHMTGNRQ